MSYSHTESDKLPCSLPYQPVYEIMVLTGTTLEGDMGKVGTFSVSISLGRVKKKKVAVKCFFSPPISSTVQSSTVIIII